MYVCHKIIDELCGVAIGPSATQQVSGSKPASGQKLNVMSLFVPHVQRGDYAYHPYKIKTNETLIKGWPEPDSEPLQAVEDDAAL